MTAQVRLRNAAGTLQSISRIRVRDDANVLRVVRRIRMRDASNALRIVYLEATPSGVSPPSVSQYGTTATITTASVSASAITGTPPYTYAWSKLYGDDIQATTPMSSITTFRKTGCAPDNEYLATFQCVATDSLAATSVVGTVDVSISRAPRDTDTGNL